MAPLLVQNWFGWLPADLLQAGRSIDSDQCKSTQVPVTLHLVKGRIIPHMKRNSRVSGADRQLSLSGLRGFVNFGLAIAAVWAILLLAPQGFAAATSTVMNTKAVICTLEATDIGGNSGCKSSAIKSQVFLSGLSGCCERSKDHKQIHESCQTQCQAAGYTLSATSVCQLPAHALIAMKFVPRVIGDPNSLLDQRLNRPPIIDHLA